MQPYQITEEVLDLEVKVSKYLKRAKAKARHAFLTYLHLTAFKPECK